ncbi:MAG: radical SAM protein [Aggregatilineales bacterium]
MTINLYALDLQGMTQLLTSWGEPAFRAKQLYEWVYTKRARSFDEMTNLPSALRRRLSDETTLGTLKLVTEQRSHDGTLKRLYQLPDGQLIESVLMPYDDHRRTACISSQAGCAMGCVFCATGQMGFARHLTAEEIFEQAIAFARELEAEGDRLSNVVLMGMGEPFHNYDATLTAVRATSPSAPSGSSLPFAALLRKAYKSRWPSACTKPPTKNAAPCCRSISAGPSRS